jgi:iron complex transport system substrate-binding protein
VKIVTLQPYVTDLLIRFGAGSDLVGVSHLDRTWQEDSSKPLKIAVLTGSATEPVSYLDAEAERLARGLTRYSLNLERLKALAPDVILAGISESDRDGFTTWAGECLSRKIGKKVSVIDVSLDSLPRVYQVIENLGGLIGQRVEARSLVNNIKAQVMSWADSFFDRCRGKQVAVLSEVSPIVVEQGWLSDLIRLIGAKTIKRSAGKKGLPVEWSEVVAARTDVLVVAPFNYSISESVRTLSALQQLPGWDDIPAVKRGEVIFAPGIDLYRPGPRFLKGIAVLVSAIAGLDSGYITERDEFFKVRYLELHRHRFL